MQMVFGKEVPWIHWVILCCQIYVDNANQAINKPNNPERKFNILIFIAATDSPSKNAIVVQSMEKSRLWRTYFFTWHAECLKKLSPVLWLLIGCFWIL